jgi:hypothetical protein
MLSCLEAMFACLPFRLNQLSIVIRHCLVKSILHGVLFEAYVPQVLLQAVRKSFNRRKIISCKREGKISFSVASVLASGKNSRRSSKIKSTELTSTHLL